MDKILFLLFFTKCVRRTLTIKVLHNVVGKLIISLYHYNTCWSTNPDRMTAIFSHSRT